MDQECNLAIFCPILQGYRAECFDCNKCPAISVIVEDIEKTNEELWALYKKRRELSCSLQEVVERIWILENPKVAEKNEKADKFNEEQKRLVKQAAKETRVKCMTTNG